MHHAYIPIETANAERGEEWRCEGGKDTLVTLFPRLFPLWLLCIYVTLAFDLTKDFFAEAAIVGWHVAGSSPVVPYFLSCHVAVAGLLAIQAQLYDFRCLPSGALWASTILATVPALFLAQLIRDVSG